MNIPSSRSLCRRYLSWHLPGNTCRKPKTNHWTKFRTRWADSGGKTQNLRMEMGLICNLLTDFNLYNKKDGYTNF